jgi:hypothetical protein
VFASISETFCLAAHEVFAFGIPIIISDLDAIRPFFNTSNAATFNPFSVRSLLLALEQSVHPRFISKRAEAEELQYGSIAAAYNALLSGMPSTRSSQLDLAASYLKEQLGFMIVEAHN